MASISITRTWFGLGSYVVAVHNGGDNREIWRGKSWRNAFYEARRVAIINSASFIETNFALPADGIDGKAVA